MKYVPYEDGLVHLLSVAERHDGSTPLENLHDISTANFIFWQRMKEQSCHACVPDVLIDITHKNGNKTTILVEAKYGSGKSSEADESDKPYDQLAREWDNLVAYTKRNNSTPYLLYVTADISFPNIDIEESQSDYSRIRGNKIDVIWLSWRKLPAVFQNNKHEIIKDLVEILRQQGLTFFEGFNINTLERSKWQFQNPPIEPRLHKPLQLNWLFSIPKMNWEYDNRLIK